MKLGSSKKRTYETWKDWNGREIIGKNLKKVNEIWNFCRMPCPRSIVKRNA